MARSTIRITGSIIDFVRPDGSIEFQFDTDEIHADLRPAVFAYGAKQILADGGAVGRNVPDAERIAKMHKRATALTSGAWGFRSGHPTERPASEFAAMYAALVAAAAFPDTAESRDLWGRMRPTEKRAVFAACPEAADHMPAPASVDGGALLERLQRAA